MFILRFMLILKKGISLFLLFISLIGALYVKAQKTATDDLYQTRMAALKSTIDLTYHPSAKPFIEEYLNNPEKVRELIGRSKYYFPLIERALRAKGMPSDLKYLAATASNLDPSAVNSNGASGIWMMTYTVSKMYKLKVNTYVDERRDPIKSSNIASQHFKDLYSIYKSWPLAIASYGCSPVTLNKCIHISNNSLYFWDIYPHMPSFCKDLYPKIIATAYILNYYKEHGIKTAEPKFEVQFDTVLVNKWLSFQQITSVTGASIDELKELNPSFRKEIIPLTLDGYYIKIPKSKSANFFMLKDTVYKPINPSEIQPNTIQRSDEQLIDSINDKVSNKSQNTTNSKNKKEDTNYAPRQIIYIVKRGENIGDIADWFDVTIFDIKDWNWIQNNNMKANQKLTIWVDGNKTGYYKKINKMSVQQKKKLKKKD